MKTVFAFLLAVGIASNANASVRIFDSSGVDKGQASELKLSTNLDVAITSGKAVVSLVGSPDGLVQNQIATSGDLTVSQCGATVVNTLSEAFYVLPDISADSALGCRFTFIVGVTAANTGLRISPHTEYEQILTLTNAMGDAVSADLQGESVTVEAIKAGANPLWAIVGAQSGTWVDLN